MRTLEKHVIIYDDACPLCNVYTEAFVKTRMLDANGRQAYTCMPSETAVLLDEDRAHDEIALVDVQSGTVTYGVDSLFKIIGHRFPICRHLFDLTPFRWLARIAYAFVSYNRKVIIPGHTFEAPGTCTPTFHPGYRLAYIGLAWVVSAWVLTAFAGLLVPLVPASNFGREFAVCGAQLLFQGVLVGALRKDRLIHYLGNMMTVSLAGSLLLIPALLLHGTGIELSPLLYAGWFTVVVSLMLIEHFRRTNLLGVSAAATIGWVAYRLIVLAILF